MVTELRNHGSFDLAWPTKPAVMSRLDRERATDMCDETNELRKGNHEQRDGSHLLSLHDASLYEAFCRQSYQTRIFSLVVALTYDVRLYIII